VSEVSPSNDVDEAYSYPDESSLISPSGSVTDFDIIRSVHTKRPFSVGAC
jgi:hypothetical protein